LSEGIKNPSKIEIVVLCASKLSTIKCGHQHGQSVKLSVEIFIEGQNFHSVLQQQ
jgi:hypothetical protein